LEIAINAARHGKHVYCEKPLANNAASARQMYEAVRSVGCVHAVSFVYRLWPDVAFAKRLIHEGRIGKVLQFQARFLHEFTLDPRTPLTWRLDAERAGSGSIGDIGSHVIDADSNPRCDALDNSSPKRSNRWRRVLALRYIAADAQFGAKTYTNYGAGAPFEREYFLVHGRTRTKVGPATWCL
jgi:hypothetical protein